MPGSHPSSVAVHLPAYLRSEPFVSYFTFRTSDQSDFLLPFQLMGYVLLPGVFLTLALMLTGAGAGQSMAIGTLFLGAIFLPFYLPGILFYFVFARKFESVSLEIDSRHDLIQFCDPRSGTNLLFRPEDITGLNWRKSMALPYKIDLIDLTLASGHVIRISSLIVEPEEFFQMTGLMAKVEHKWLLWPSLSQ